jgi:hypothetical protein
VLSAAEVFAGNLADELTFDGVDNGYLDMSIDGYVADADKNNSADLVDAATTGDLVISTYTKSFTGVLNAASAREACAADTTCEAFESCQLQQDVLNDCQANTVCVQRVGEKQGGESCTNGQQCRSGACLATHKCLEICANDADCNSGLGCSDNTVNVPVTTDLSAPVTACGM